MAKNLVSELLLVLNHPVDPFFYRSSTNELVHEDVAFLSNAKGAIGSLVLNCRIPPPIEMYNVGSCGQVQSRTTSLHRNYKKRYPIVLLELPYELLPLGYRHGSMENKTRPLEQSTKVRC